jgi:hypothetical protein
LALWLRRVRRRSLACAELGVEAGSIIDWWGRGPSGNRWPDNGPYRVLIGFLGRFGRPNMSDWEAVAGPKARVAGQMILGIARQDDDDVQGRLRRVCW